MTLRMEQVTEQLPGAVARFKEQMARREAGLSAAGEALNGWGDDPDGGNRKVEAALAGDPRPYATAFREAPSLVREAGPFTPVTVVAADGSAIEPDRFAPVQCFVVNVGTVVLPYGCGLPGQLSATASIGPEALHEEGEDHGEDDTGPFSWGVNLHRDAAELDAASRLAAGIDGDVVALIDGTLLPWDLDSPRVSERIRDRL
ncbi:MAG TPA: DNA double-strand break repair nuclease NurA, partial [Tepidiformaceae bacterium]|nr:DNA double-strand break repair nuclease NurA [Tepidiformaceae bacterium]